VRIVELVEVTEDVLGSGVVDDLDGWVRLGDKLAPVRLEWLASGVVGFVFVEIDPLDCAAGEGIVGVLLEPAEVDHGLEAVRAGHVLRNVHHINHTSLAGPVGLSR